jgi:cytochrome oxidase assembly protein ShyY1
MPASPQPLAQSPLHLRPEAAADRPEPAMMPSLSSSSPLPQDQAVEPSPPQPEVGSVTTPSSLPVASPAERAVRPPKPWRPWRFALVTLATLLTLAATASLGRWQLSRAAQKIALQADIEAQKLQPPLDQDEFLALGDPAPVLHRPVRLRGLWLGPQTVYLDNRQMHGLTGFYVLTPFALEGSERTVLVQRGWIPRNFTDRAQLAPVETPSGLVEITALVAPPPGRLLDLGKAEPALPAASDASTTEAWAAAAASAASDAVATVTATIAATKAADAVDPAASSSATTPSASLPIAGTTTTADANGTTAGATDAAAGASTDAIAGAGNGTRPASAAARNAAAAAAITAARDRAVGSSPIRQNLDLVAFRTETRLPLRTDLTLQQAGAASEGLLRDWPAPALGVEKHQGYAFQWFGLTGLVALLYVWFQLIAPWRRSRRQRRG